MGLLLRDETVFESLFRGTDCQTDIEVAVQDSSVDMWTGFAIHGSRRQFHSIFNMSVLLLGPSLLAGPDKLVGQERYQKQTNDHNEGHDNGIPFLATQTFQAFWMDTRMSRRCLSMVLIMVTTTDGLMASRSVIWRVTRCVAW